MSTFLKRISLMLLLMLLISGCAKKLPPQGSEGKAFSKQPYIVQGNIQYQIKEYRVGTNENVSPKQEYIKFLVEAKNLGKAAEKLKPGSVKLISGTNNYSPGNPKSSNLFRININPQQSVEDWIMFDIKNKLAKKLYLQINNGKIEVNLK